MSVPLIFDRDLLRVRRSRALKAGLDADFLLTHVAKEIAERLALIKREFPVALELGGYTGVVAKNLLQRPGTDRVFRAETLPGLVKPWPYGKLVCEPEDFPFGEETLDLVLCPLSLHLINDVPGVLLRISRSLRPDGLFFAVFLGSETLREMREVLLFAESECTGGAGQRVIPFVEIRSLGSLLQRAEFALPVVDTERLTVSYQDLFALMHDLRAMGMTNMLTSRSRKPLRREVLLRAAELYAASFTNAQGRITATFELIYAIGWKYHPSQQKPLQPGSANLRLADALKGKN